ncbi:divergent polysaccharide deacetylase family protein [Desulfobacter hydrogenophilus]|uniref:Divergent polysaccharide deacetylase family protein n=1 Tax=Desulfobacter hydrogenophilus TaxID=2291 RepID=A0A328FFS2_9BACT|nr:divergent polysaccharide deacetylase family protein [Desulfobacter hydrogenophilus]NDY71465.1 divergent polysaccharide deacetylase family protein [Desulfobacter hydrogenophilus]QBH12202.1 divergent polysaccharide deacetylase family protein [Desulfobacter hydrogenophilus]RAM03474.1 divergent polysaccharide deacetylase family protein [Desulfobacter hydrogenophilus]
MAQTKSTGGTKKRPGKKAKPPAPQKTTKTAPKKSTKTKKKPRTASKAGTKKPAKKKNPDFFHELKKTVLGIAILVSVCLTAAMLIDIFIQADRPVAPKTQAVAQPQDPVPPPPRQKHQPPETKRLPTAEPKIISKAKSLKGKNNSAGKSSIAESSLPREGSAIVYEVYEDVTPAPTKKVIPPKKNNFVPRIAIIIDDIGYNKELAMGLFNIDKNITFSILPFSPAGTQLAHSLSAKGAELMLHLPMEPTQYPKVNPGPGALLSSMSPDELLTQLRKDIHAVPGTVGANNHMGSRLTADSDKMNQIFTVLKQKNLFFVDSRTSAESKGEQSARMFQLKFSHRDVFLDNFQDIEYISGQIKKLIKQAKDHGSAIGIGHPHQATLDALKRELPKLKEKARLVPASRLVEVPES